MSAPSTHSDKTDHGCGNEHPHTPPPGRGGADHEGRGRGPGHGKKDHGHGNVRSQGPGGHDHDHGPDAGGHDHSRGITARQVWLVAVSEAAIAVGFILKWMMPAPVWPALACFAIGTLAGGWLVFPQAFRSLRRGRLDMNVLMTVAVIGAWIMGEAAEGAAVVFLFALAELLESWSVGRARQAIRALMALTPETALRKRPGTEPEEVPADSVQPGEVILVRSGERIPLDGEITDGRSSVDQSPITGESVPADKVPGDPVFAGTINGGGALEIRVTRLADDSTLARIIRQVETAAESKAPTQRLVDRFARIYTPAVFLLALGVAVLPPLLGGLWTEWIYRALVLLVIACPCALVIATPVSIVAGLTSLAKRGVLIKGGAFLEAVGRLRALAVDKTGTLTVGHPRVVHIYPWVRHGDEDLLGVAASMDTFSTHPMARAVVEAAWTRGVAFTPAINYQARIGRGAEAVIDGVPHFIGNHKMAHGMGVCSPALERLLETIESRGESLAIVGRQPAGDREGEVLGVLAIADTLRPETREALKRLHGAGIEKIIMLSGDNQRTATAIARKAGIDEARGDLLPEQKVEAIQNLLVRFKNVGMIGDGVNDAPALAVATVGIAMGAAGSDTAIETADMALMNDDLRNLADAILVGRRTVEVIRFNVAFAIAVKAVFLLLALTGHTSLWLAILADTGATLLVIANALRLLRFQEQPSNNPG
ncbi:MAG: heavy metal translocating P-type ATPase [Verrucomicrobiota bacterium]